MLFFFYGEDQWRKTQKIKALTDKFLREVDSSRMNFQVLEVNGLEEGTLEQAVHASPFLARKRLLVLKNIVTQGRKALSEVLEKALPSLAKELVLVISEDAAKPKTWKNKTAEQVWNYLEKNAKSEEFAELWGAKLEAEIVKQAKARGLSLEKNAAEMLTIMSQSNLGWVEQELAKLEAYCSTIPTTQVTSAQIKLLSTAEGEANIFEFLDALAGKDRVTLLHTAEEQLHETDALHLVSRASGHLHAMLAMALARQSGAQALKLHPFQAKKISATLRKWNVLELKNFLFQLMALEYAVKTGRAPDAQTQLASLLVRNAAA